MSWRICHIETPLHQVVLAVISNLCLAILHFAQLSPILFHSFPLEDPVPELDFVRIFGGPSQIVTSLVSLEDERMFTKFSQSPGARHVLGECRCFLRIEEAAGACQDTCCMLNPFNRSHEIPRHSITLKICSEKPFFFLGREDLISNHLVRGLSFQPCVVRDPRGVHLKSVALVISAIEWGNWCHMVFVLSLLSLVFEHCVFKVKRLS